MKMIFILLSLSLGLSAHAGENFEYKVGGATMEGYVAVPTTKQRYHPAVLIVHDWMGVNDFTRKKADQMAELGYLAFVADIYGKGERPKDAGEAGQLAGKFKSDMKLFRARVKGAYDALLKQHTADKNRVVAFGYCFGGTAVLELARMGTKLAGVASFHGSLATPNTKDDKNIKTKVLVLHGAVDPYVPQTEVQEFLNSMNEAKVDYQFIAYSGAVHAFAVPGAGNDPKTGAAYNADADKRSWQAFMNLLGEVAPL